MWFLWRENLRSVFKASPNAVTARSLIHALTRSPHPLRTACCIDPPGLMNSYFEDRIAAKLVQSPLVRQLTTIDLSMVSCSGLVPSNHHKLVD